MLADAEIIALIHETLTALGLKSIVRVNNRKILNGLAVYAGFSEEKTPGVLRILDKLDKIQWEGVRYELTLQPKNEFETQLVALTDTQVDAIKKFLDVRAQGHASVLDAVEALMSNSPIALEGIRELREVIEYVDAFGITREAWTIDLSVARGLGYYTGPVFEGILTDLPSIGSVFSGGRYDDLVSRFGVSTIPATGASVGVDRIYAAMEQLKLLDEDVSTTKVLVLNFDDVARVRCTEVAALLRKANIATDVYMGQEKTMKGQLVYGVKRNIPIVVIIGSEELAQGTATVKDTRSRKQEQVLLPFLAGHVKKLL
jgi:histidyl-tRNA synthetase